MTQKNSHSKTALITGATVGIGYQFCRLFAKDGYNLVLVARNAKKLEARKDELQEEYGIKVNVLAKDLSNPQVPEEIYSVLKKASIPIDVLVNNAGFGGLGKFSELPLDTQLGMIRLNVVALTELTNLFLKDMMIRGNGKVMNIASTAAFMPGPLQAVYYATKAYVLSFSRALANELKGSGITVCVVCPGPTETEFFERAGIGNAWIAKLKTMSAESVARIGYRGLQKGKKMVITGLMNKVMIHSLRFFPTKPIIAFVRMLQEKRGE